jgi:FtsP/CotA-like multicopper oxidase with cupredoxin domain
VHLHLNHFRVPSRNTVDVRPAEAVEIVTRFTDHPGIFPQHCHNLEQEDMAMKAA